VIEVHTVPATDAAFREAVRAAIAAVDSVHPPPAQVVASSEATLRAALRAIRSRYPEVAIRPRESLASSHPGQLAWYVFREAP
jgi:hypothetical protein